MIRFILMNTIVFTLLTFIVFELKVLIKYLSEGEFGKTIIMGALSVIALLFDFSGIAMFKFSLTFIISKLIVLSIIWLIFAIYKYDEKIITIAIVMFIASCGIYLFGINFTNKIVYDEMPKKVETHFVTKTIKREASKQDLESELKLILKYKKKNNDFNLSKDSINNVIKRELKYKEYNGIRCYAVEEINENQVVIGMNVGETATMKWNTEIGNTKNFLVDRNSLEILGEYHK